MLHWYINTHDKNWLFYGLKGETVAEQSFCPCHNITSQCPNGKLHRPLTGDLKYALCSESLPNRTAFMGDPSAPGKLCLLYDFLDSGIQTQNEHSQIRMEEKLADFEVQEFSFLGEFAPFISDMMPQLHPQATCMLSLFGNTCLCSPFSFLKVSADETCRNEELTSNKWWLAGANMPENTLCKQFLQWIPCRHWCVTLVKQP